MKIKCTSDLSYQAYKKFFKITMGKMDWLYYVFDTIIGIAVVGALISVISDGVKNLPTLVLYLAVLVVVIFIQCYIPKLSYKRTKIDGQSVDEFTFTEENVHIVSNAKNISSTADLTYDTFLSAYESKTHVFLYIAKDRAYIIDKNTVTGGNFDRVRDILIKNIGIKKYKIKF